MPSSSPTSLGGEFLDREREATFQAARLSETSRQSSLLFFFSAALSLLLFMGAWRFYGEAIFYAAVSASTITVLVSVLCLWNVWRDAAFDRIQNSLIAWEWVTSAAIAVMVGFHGSRALPVILLLPSIYYLAAPTTFYRSLVSGISCSTMMLAGYVASGESAYATIALAFFLIALNLILTFFVTRMNRVRRMEWLAVQSEQIARQELDNSKLLFRQMFKTVPIPLLVAQTDGVIIETNDASVQFLGATLETLGIRTIEEFFANPEDYEAFLAVLTRQGHVSNFETRARLANGSSRTVLLAGRLLDIRGVIHVMAAVVDITDRKASEERIWRAARHDPLTHLPNRAFFQSRLEQTLAQAERSGASVALLLIDLDHLKMLNNTLGHDAGDALIKHAAERLSDILQDRSIVARLKSDEFVIIVEPAQREEVQTLTEQILADLRKPFAYKDSPIVGRASIGIAFYPEHDRQPTDLMKDADLALQSAKSQGRDRAIVYSPEMRQNTDQAATTRRDIQGALRKGEIVPFYQPKIDLRSGQITGFEALARWHHPVRGLLTPASFTEAFTDPELSIAFGEYMIRHVATDIKTWLDQGLDCGRVAVNLSTAQFSWIGLARRFLDTLHAIGVPNERLEVEITETVFLGRGTSHVAMVLKEFQDNGVRIALDDFGTGYASFIHLKQFPVDDIKIDQSFVRDLEKNAESTAIVLALIELGTSLDMNVIAEGVETSGQADFLRKIGCAQAQGNFFALPMPADNVPAFLQGQRSV